MQKTITVQFTKRVFIEIKDLCALLTDRYEDVERVEIDTYLNSDLVKTITITCEQTTAQEILDYIKTGNFVKEKDKRTKKMVQEPGEITGEIKTLGKEVNVDETCEGLGKAFKALFGNTGGLAESIVGLQKIATDQQAQISALEKLLNGSPAKGQTPPVLGLKDAVEGIRQEANKAIVEKTLQLSTKVDEKIVQLDAKETRIVSIEETVAKIETHLTSFPVYGVKENGIGDTTPRKPGT